MHYARTVSLAVDPHESEVKSLSYEIRSSDGTKVIENRKISALESSETGISELQYRSAQVF